MAPADVWSDGHRCVALAKLGTILMQGSKDRLFLALFGHEGLQLVWSCVPVVVHFGRRLLQALNGAGLGWCRPDKGHSGVSFRSK